MCFVLLLESFDPLSEAALHRCCLTRLFVESRLQILMLLLSSCFLCPSHRREVHQSLVQGCVLKSECLHRR